MDLSGGAARRRRRGPPRREDPGSVSLARGPRLEGDARLRDGRKPAHRLVSRQAPRSRRFPVAPRRAHGDRVVRRHPPPGRALLLGPQHRKAGPVGALHGPPARRHADGSPRPERHLPRRQLGLRGVRHEPRRGPLFVRPFGRRRRLAELARPQREAGAPRQGLDGSRRRCAGRASVHQVLRAVVRARRQGPLLQPLPRSGRGEGALGDGPRLQGLLPRARYAGRKGCGRLREARSPVVAVRALGHPRRALPHARGR